MATTPETDPTALDNCQMPDTEYAFIGGRRYRVIAFEPAAIRSIVAYTTWFFEQPSNHSDQAQHTSNKKP